MNKKAQGLSSETIILLIIAVVVLAIVILGFTKGWSWVFSIFGMLPGDLEKAKQACDFAGTNNLETTYCNEFKEVNIAGKSQYLNCDGLEKYASFTFLDGNCNPNMVSDLSKQLCINEKLKNETLVNEVSCETLTGS